MALEALDIVNGIFGVLFVIISIIVGVKIALKYFNNKDINILLVGLTWVFIVSGWYGTSASFLIALLMGNEGLSFEMIMLLNFLPLPLALFFWMTAFTNFLYQEKQKMVLILCGMFIVIFYGIFFYFLITDPIVIGEKISPVDTKANSLLLGLFLVILLIVILVTGVKFSLVTLKFDNPETKLKGKLLLIAFPSFCIGGFLDALIPSTTITLVIFRVILISSAIEFYSAFIMPSFLKKRLLRHDS